MRGRSSEGVDFLDACARAVLVVGIPYPPLYDVTVRLKRAFNHEHEALLGSGDDWYAAEAFRAVNQAVGRLQRVFTASPDVWNVACHRHSLCWARSMATMSCTDMSLLTAIKR